ncbi:hypothetical protein Tco_0914524 [Tanacetum coccineum]
MHTIMVPEQVKTLTIQARVQVSRPEDTEDIFSIGSAMEDFITVVFVLVRNIFLMPWNVEDALWRMTRARRVSIDSKALAYETDLDSVQFLLYNSLF